MIRADLTTMGLFCKRWTKTDLDGTDLDPKFSESTPLFSDLALNTNSAPKAVSSKWLIWPYQQYWFGSENQFGPKSSQYQMADLALLRSTNTQTSGIHWKSFRMNSILWGCTIGVLRSRHPARFSLKSRHPVPFYTKIPIPAKAPNFLDQLCNEWKPSIQTRVRFKLRLRIYSYADENVN